MRIHLNEKEKNWIKKFLKLIHYDYGHWARTVMYQECFKLIHEIDSQRLNTLEISAGQNWKQIPFKSYTEANYPDFDICEGTLPDRFDLIIADQVFEHLLWPYRAGKNVYEMLEYEGYFIISTPFLIRVHNVPTDCSRWTESGLKHFLAECGFPIEKIRTGSWGNRACVKGNLNRWVRRGWFRSLHNEPMFPVTVWAIAQK